MKFAKELEEDLVPEWRAKYFDYKIGKKKVKAVNRALRSVENTPRTPGRQLPANLLNNALHSSRPPFSKSASTRTTPRASAKSTPIRAGSTLGKDVEPNHGAEGDGLDISDYASPISIPGAASPPSGAPGSGCSSNGNAMNYGSFIASPPSNSGLKAPPSLELPDPALPPEEDAFAKHNRAWRQSHVATKIHPTPQAQGEGKPGDAYQVGAPQTPVRLESSQLLPKHKRFLRPRRAVSTPHGGLGHRPQFLRRIFSSSGPQTPVGDMPLGAYKLYEEKQAEFFKFLDQELAKIETFYKMKESQANKRLQALRDQLHEMRDRRIEEIRREQEAKKNERLAHRKSSTHSYNGYSQHGHHEQASSIFRWMKPIESAVGIGPARIGKTSKALQKLGSPNGPIAQNLPTTARPESWRDFTRRPERSDIPYRAAKRKLKLALQEFYRGLELLKSYALLNRTAFRKINKKYDKAVKARPTQRYMTEKVNKSWFVQSEVLDHQIVAVEDLYARYFERGNHKVAVGKLRSKTSKAGDYAGSIFRNGLLIAGGVVFGIQGIVYSSRHQYDSDPKLRTDATYLMQIYGGYFLMLLLFLLFCIDCKIWTSAKINYPFIFEFDARHSLDWHRLAELPCLLLFLLGLFVWLNFQQRSTNPMYLYWPIILIGLSVMILFFPGPILYHRSRGWWAYSNFRLLLAGLYPVEFRDFFLGDMYCSQTYSMGNLELFFCLYAHNFSNPVQCNSNHSRLLGFFSTLPGIWRALQCLRRYYDTRNAFPHLVNCGKYMFTISAYMTLSLYRIDQTMSLKALFIACSTINSIYCSVWDLAMDWSLLNPYAQHPFLRDVLGYKRPSLYYIAMILDPILRFNWIFYAIFRSDIQHSALMSFMIALSEVFRRGIWSLFRVENEHCTNVGRFRASRDVPLPYDLPSPSQTPSPIEEADEIPESELGTVSHPNTMARNYSIGSSSALEAQGGTPRLRRRATLTESETPIIRGIARAGTAITKAHAQDFERRRRPYDTTIGVEGIERSPHYQGKTVGYDDSSGEEDDEDEVEHLEEAAATEGESPVRRLRSEEERQEAEDDRIQTEDMRGVQDVIDRRRSAVE